MTRFFSKDLLIVLGLIVILYICFESLHMPMAFVMFAHALLVLGYVLFALFVWREHSHDEREHAHQMFAGRVAFIAGAGMLVCGVVVQGVVRHEVDPWLLWTLVVMVCAKIGARAYSARKQ